MINDDLRWTQRGWFGNLQPSAAKTTKRCRAESTHCASGCKMTHPAGVKKPSVKHGSCEYHLAEIQSVTNLKLAAIMRPLGWFTYIYIYICMYTMIQVTSCEVIIIVPQISWSITESWFVFFPDVASISHVMRCHELHGQVRHMATHVSVCVLLRQCCMAYERLVKHRRSPADLVKR